MGGCPIKMYRYRPPFNVPTPPPLWGGSGGRTPILCTSPGTLNGGSTMRRRRSTPHLMYRPRAPPPNGAPSGTYVPGYPTHVKKGRLPSYLVPPSREKTFDAKHGWSRLHGRSTTGELMHMYMSTTNVVPPYVFKLFPFSAPPRPYVYA